MMMRARRSRRKRSIRQPCPSMGAPSKPSRRLRKGWRRSARISDPSGRKGTERSQLGKHKLLPGAEKTSRSGGRDAQPTGLRQKPIGEKYDMEFEPMGGRGGVRDTALR